QIEAVFTPTGAFLGNSGILNQRINQATPTITWPSPQDIVFGTALSPFQLDATATNPENGTSVPGSFSYDPGKNTVLSAGSSPSLGVTFTPADTKDYTPATGSTSINITKHTPKTN